MLGAILGAAPEIDPLFTSPLTVSLTIPLFSSPSLSTTLTAILDFNPLYNNFIYRVKTGNFFN
jgi:hypothetical protein